MPEVILKQHIFTGQRCTGGNNCCTELNPCGNKQGDCDNDKQCQGDMICLKNTLGENCIKGSLWTQSDDCCLDPNDLSTSTKIAHKLQKFQTYVGIPYTDINVGTAVESAGDFLADLFGKKKK